MNALRDALTVKMGLGSNFVEYVANSVDTYVEAIQTIQKKTR